MLMSDLKGLLQAAGCLRMRSIPSRHNHVRYRQSHVRHHVSTRHPPRGLEATLPIRRLHMMAVAIRVGSMANASMRCSHPGAYSNVTAGP